jgi:hypothetical protein
MALFDRIQNNTTLFMLFFFFFFFFIFDHPSKTKHSHFFTFYITPIIFYSLQSKTFSLFYTFFKIFISHHHFLQIPKLTTHYSVIFLSRYCNILVLFTLLSKHGSRTYQIKNILTFLHFLHHINNFLLLLNQKNSLQNKTFSLFYKTFLNFISHQSFLTTIQINIPIHNHLLNNHFSYEQFFSFFFFFFYYWDRIIFYFPFLSDSEEFPTQGLCP